MELPRLELAENDALVPSVLDQFVPSVWLVLVPVVADELVPAVVLVLEPLVTDELVREVLLVLLLSEYPVVSLVDCP